MSAPATQMLPTRDTVGAFELPEVRAEHVAGQASRREGAYGLPRATEFSDDCDLMNPRWVVRQMKRFPSLWDEVRDATRRQYVGEGRRGYEEGDWAHVFAVFTMSDTAYLTTFWESHQESTLWTEAGFPVVPAFNTMETNFRALESSAPAITAAAYKLMRWAEQCDPRVNQDWHIDGTAYHSAAQLEHCCPDRDACRAAGGRPPKFVPKLPDQTIKEKRHAVQGSAETKTHADDEVVGVRDLLEGELAGFEPDPRYRYQWLNVGGGRGGRHLFRSLDKTAATRLTLVGAASRCGTAASPWQALTTTRGR